MNSKINRKQFSLWEVYLLGLIVVLLLSACFLNQTTNKPIIETSKQDSAININKEIMVLMSIGHKRFLTDLLWVQTLIESDTEHYKKKDLNNWLFLRFSAISTLDPLFYENYVFGGQFLSIVKDDLEGASLIYTKGLSLFPGDYNLNFQAGFLYYYEMGDPDKGLPLLKKIENHKKAPIFLTSIINKLQLAVDHDLTGAFELVKLHYENTKEPTLKNKLASDLYSIRAQIDLKCLNNNLGNCSRVDLRGNPYELRGSVFYSKNFFKKYEIATRKAKNSIHELMVNTVK